MPIQLQGIILQTSNILASLSGFFQCGIAGNITCVRHTATKKRLPQFGLVKAVYPALHADAGSGYGICFILSEGKRDLRWRYAEWS